MVRRADYGGHVPATHGGIVESVDAGGPAARAAVSVGDAVEAVDAAPLRDVLDWQWHTSDAASIDVRLRSADGRTRDVTLSREPGEAWGIGFAGAVFDAVRTCRNACSFCFVTQLPRGLRASLYVRDDDFRLSFLQGNFITLTNLADADVDRIVEQALSPLYVSLHAVTPAVRSGLICAAEDDALARLTSLLEGGIDVHVQIVLVPGVNDGSELEQSLTWLAEREGIASVGVVPLGYTAHQTRFAESYRGLAARAVVDQVTPWQEAMRERDGLTWVHLADEFYLAGGLPLPDAEHYDGFPQYENGIGIARSFVDDVADLASELRAAASEVRTPVTLVSGELAAPVIGDALVSSGVVGIEVGAVPNRFFGGSVSVAGLLTGHDLVSWLRAAPSDRLYLVPDTLVNTDGMTLDGLLASTIGERSDRRVALVSSDAAGLLAGVRAASRDTPSA